MSFLGESLVQNRRSSSASSSKENSDNSSKSIFWRNLVASFESIGGGKALANLDPIVVFSAGRARLPPPGEVRLARTPPFRLVMPFFDDFDFAVCLLLLLTTGILQSVEKERLPVFLFWFSRARQSRRCLKA